jgi:hypothetical protein
MLKFVVSPAGVTRFLSGVAVSLVLLSVAAQFLVPQIPKPLLKKVHLAWTAWQFTVQFKLSNEMNIPTCTTRACSSCAP